jgi:hypothetical protein
VQLLAMLLANIIQTQWYLFRTPIQQL